jgi:hypothetical protein
MRVAAAALTLFLLAAAMVVMVTSQEVVGSDDVAESGADALLVGYPGGDAFMAAPVKVALPLATVGNTVPVPTGTCVG